jgi:hypothetical protein
VTWQKYALQELPLRAIGLADNMEIFSATPMTRVTRMFSQQLINLIKPDVWSLPSASGKFSMVNAVESANSNAITSATGFDGGALHRW